MKDLKKCRRDAGMTQYGLADATSIPRWKISHAELGIIKLSTEEADLIRRTLVDVARKKSARVLGALATA